MTRATLRGVPAAPGTGIASAFLFPSLAFQVSGAAAGQADPDEQKALFARACEGIRAELLAAEEGTAPGCLTAMLSDHLFRGSVIDRIDAGMTAADAVVQTTNDLIVIYGELPTTTTRRGWFRGARGRRTPRRCT